MSSQTIWRDGIRIRRSDGIGYIDSVSDETIRNHIDAHTSTGDPLFILFAEAVLAIRAFERASAEVSR